MFFQSYESNFSARVSHVKTKQIQMICIGLEQGKGE